MVKFMQDKNIRMIWSKDGSEVWFSANDIGAELGIEKIRNIISNIDNEYKDTFTDNKISNAHKTYIRNFTEKLPNRGELFITEEAVYNISFRSNKPEAKLFTKWVSQVLKQIRINGYYIATDKDEQWLGARDNSKDVRRAETDSIKEFVEYAKTQGSSKPEKYYIHFTNLVRNKLGIPKGLKREDMSQEMMLKILGLEVVIGMKLPSLIDDDTPYKQVYQEVKKLISII